MRNRWLIVFSAAIISMVGFGSRGIFGVFYVEMLEKFDWGRANLAGVYSVGMVIMGLGGAFAGAISQRIGIKRFYAFSGILVGLSLILASQVQTLVQVYLTWGLLGGLSLAALGLGPAQGLVVRWFQDRRGLAIGIVYAGSGGSTVLAPLAQYLIESFGWRSALVIAGGISAFLVILLGSLVITEPPATNHTRSNANHREPINPPPDGSTLRLALRTSPLWLIALAWFFTSSSIHFVLTHLVAFLIGIGHTALFSSSLIALWGICFVGSQALSGAISDRFGRARTFLLGAVIAAAGFLILLFHHSAENTWVPQAFAILFGLGVGAQTTITMTLASDHYRSPNFATIAGFLTIGFGLGGGLGPWLGGLIYEWTGSYQSMVGYVLFAFFCSSICMLTASKRLRNLRLIG
jgi:MFS family permease